MEYNNNAILRIVVALFSLVLPLLASSQIFTCDGLQYRVISAEEQTVETYYGGGPAFSGHFDVPEKVTDANGNVYTVVQIGWYSFQTSSITSVSLPSTIREIRTSAFTRCPLTEINFPAGVRSIDGNAFSGCNGLHEVVLPDSLLSLGDFAFSSCANLERVTFNNKLRSIGKSVFYQTPLKSVSLPGSLRTIGDVAFGSCKQLEEINLSEGLESVGQYAFTFDGSDKIMKIRLPSTLKSVGYEAFDCDTLVCSWGTPPCLNSKESWYHWVTTFIVPKGTKHHYAKVSRWPNDYYYVEDESLGAYCDINIECGDGGAMVCDSTVIWDGYFRYVPQGQAFNVQIKPIDKYLIKTFTRDGQDMTELLGEISLWDDVNDYDLSDEIVPDATYRVRNLQETTTFAATFEKQKFTRIALRQGEGGTLTMRTYRDEPLQFVIRSAEGSAIKSVTLNHEDKTNSVAADGSFAIGNIDDPVTMEVTFGKE